MLTHCKDNTQLNLVSPKSATKSATASKISYRYTTAILDCKSYYLALLGVTVLVSSVGGEAVVRSTLSIGSVFC